jgi:hypothetical protein
MLRKNLRAPSLIKIIKTETWFIESLNFKKVNIIHRKILLVFFDLIKDVPLIILIVFSSFAVWRIGYIRQLLANEKDFRKRMFVFTAYHIGHSVHHNSTI